MDSKAKCSFCGTVKNDNTILIVSETGAVICNHCINTSKLLIADELYVDHKVVNIKSPLTNSVA
jgi:ATP-dependent protease Clp ATPase subunit